VVPTTNGFFCSLSSATSPTQPAACARNTGRRAGEEPGVVASDADSSGISNGLVTNRALCATGRLEADSTVSTRASPAYAALSRVARAMSGR
jgi:hypothetical protein